MKKFWLLFLLASVLTTFISCSNDDDDATENKVGKYSKTEYYEITKWLDKPYDEVKASGISKTILWESQEGNLEFLIYIDNKPFGVDFEFPFEYSSAVTLTPYYKDGNIEPDDAEKFAMLKEYADEAFKKFGEPEKVVYEGNWIKSTYENFWDNIFPSPATSLPTGAAFRFFDGKCRYYYYVDRTKPNGKYFFQIHITSF